MNDNHNVYAPPKASIETPPKLGAEILEFPRFSTWGVFGLAVLTLSFYLLYWLYTRTKIMNRVLPERKIPLGLSWGVIILYIINIAFGFTEGYYETNRDITMVSQIINIVTNVLLLIWVFSFRNRLNILSGSERGSDYWAGPVLTFFFQVLYLSYKVNQLIDRAKNAV